MQFEFGVSRDWDLQSRVNVVQFVLRKLLSVSANGVMVAEMESLAFWPTAFAYAERMTDC